MLNTLLNRLFLSRPAVPILSQTDLNVVQRSFPPITAVWRWKVFITKEISRSHIFPSSHIPYPLIVFRIGSQQVCGNFITNSFDFRFYSGAFLIRKCRFFCCLKKALSVCELGQYHCLWPMIRAAVLRSRDRAVCRSRHYRFSSICCFNSLKTMLCHSSHSSSFVYIMLWQFYS